MSKIRLPHIYTGHNYVMNKENILFLKQKIKKSKYNPQVLLQKAHNRYITHFYDKTA